MAAPAPNPQGRDSQHVDPPQVLVERLFARISDVSSLPAAALKIIDVANDPASGAADLLEAVEIDIGLAMRITRTVNSSYYALPNKVADLKMAITLLGFDQIRNLALTTYVAQLFKNTTGHGKYRRERLWNHLIGVGAVGRLIAGACGKVPPQEAYLAGLLHDVGLVLIDQYLHKPFCQVVDALDEDTPTCQVERTILGFHHTELGEYVATQWDLPENLTTAIRYHHAPLQYQGPYRHMVCVVALANFFCSLKGLTSLGVRNMQMPPSRIFADLGLQKRQVAAIWEQVDEVLKTADIMALAEML
jgi:HD-like signal output (HDOD) protein